MHSAFLRTSIASRLMLALVLLALCACAQTNPASNSSFHLKPGDHVVFFGDSITDQRLYTTFVETFVVTRFPTMDVRFTHSGWGGDRVTGGGGGGIRERLNRDVIAYQPSVVTVMLGMNDGRYRAFDPMIFDIYSGGYKNIVNTLKRELPGVRITAIQPSPFDDVTRKPNVPGGYNAVLLRYADFIAELAKSEGLHTADLNRPVVAMLQKAKTADAANAEKILPDRVHPGPAGHLIMAEQLLKSWNAPAVVSAVTLDAAGRNVATAENARVTDVNFGNEITWTQTDLALPLPVDLEDPVMALAVNSSGFLDALNQQTVKVTGLSAGKHTLLIDDSVVGTFTDKELAAGVNLARFRTPMWAQARDVHALTLQRANIHNTRWRQLQVPLQEEKPASLAPAITALDSLADELRFQQRAMARPKPHRFAVRAGESGFQTIFNGKDLSGWHISKTNHHGTTPTWLVEGGELTGTQDRPGEGGILLTDKKYKNFEVSLELRPDFGCDGGLFLRSSEKGEAYQVMIDYLDGGAVGGIYGERLQGVRGVSPNWRDYWNRSGWNHLRARMEGDVPHIQVWLNGTQIVDWTDTANHAAEGATEGHIAVQVHRGNRWVPGGKHRFRNIQVRELP